MEKEIKNKKTWYYYYLAFSIIIICIFLLIFGLLMYSLECFNKIDYIVNVISVSTIICVITICLTVITLRIVDKEYEKKGVSDDFVEKCLKHFDKQGDLNSQEKKNLDNINNGNLFCDKIIIEDQIFEHKYSKTCKFNDDKGQNNNDENESNNEDKGQNNNDENESNNEDKD